MPENVRAWLYRVILLVIPVLLAFNIVTDEQATVIGAAVLGAIGAGVATVNTKT